MCDIFALSSGVNYTAQEYLPIFAEKSQRNMNGWGIGFFRDNHALIEKSSERVYSQEQVHESFQRLARVVDSRIIVSHISCPLSGGRHTAHNHPFALSFLDHAWLFVHVGLIDGIEEYKTAHEPRIDVDVYPARVFEYLRDQLVSYLRYTPYGSLGRSLVKSIKNMVTEYPGNYAFFLANESVLFAFCNFRQLMLLRETESSGNSLILTSIKEGLSDKDWITIRPEPATLGKLLVIAGPDLLYLGDVV
ncbi:class II glutamine amidotransferase [Desulfoferrobacter suflitae]|uniref:class II glutamine amidotransferase n=1 Tax=Desulfoferrobacter suflitae TaxID=2865782 RepID=UPI002164BCE2|nr:class II glutamine amidotransferase [Desulfoferrobacter suflitae]MCK8602225.1 class II glutamine amidotransferase [Desulfoferrobacter suflitae]